MPGTLAVPAVAQLTAKSETSLKPDHRASAEAGFEIYCSERVSVTSILFSGGDWRWRLRSGAGTVLVNSEGYATERACRRAIIALQKNAGAAMLSVSTQY
jgi:uncharacterized protein YegP (UPF0339 family)